MKSSVGYFQHDQAVITLAYTLVSEYIEHDKNQDRLSNHRNIWHQMKSRCNNPKHHAYKNYGGRGVTVCQRWMESLSDFKDDMGPRPGLNTTLERINKGGDYTPGNCRWSTL